MMRNREDTRMRRPRQWWFWLLAAALGVALLISSVLFWGIRGERPTLRAMEASESMSDEQARIVAENTVRVWFRERNAGNLANLEALSCPEISTGAIAREVERLRSNGHIEPIKISALTGFSRKGPMWTINVIRPEHGSAFVLSVRGGELRVCQTEPAKVP